MSHDNGKSYGRNEEVGALFKLFKASRAGRLHRHTSGIPPLPETKSKQASLLAIVGQSCFKHDLTCLDFSRKW